ncbi:MAG: folate family ECF transporter S component [Clostridia bacterium]
MHYSHLAMKRLVICAILIALGVILSGLLSIPVLPLGAYTLKIGFGALPTIVAAVLYGPIYGGMVGAAVDILQALLFPMGAYIPLYTISGMLLGVLPGLFFIKKQDPSFLRLLLAISISQIIASVLLNSLWFSLLQGIPYFLIIVPRAINQAVMIPIYALLIFLIMRLLKKNAIMPERFKP